MLEELEKDREQLTNALRQAKGTEKASELLSKELEQLLYEHNGKCESPAEREAASYMVQTLRQAVPLVDTAGESRIWEQHGEGKKAGRFSARHNALLAGGAVSLVVALAAAALRQKGASLLTGLPVILLFLGVSLVLFYLAGSSRGGGRTADGGRCQVEVLPDADKIYRLMHAAVLSMDQNLEEIRRSEQWEKTHGKQETAKKEDSREWELLSGLLEASYSGDGDYALDQLKNIKYYLHQKGVELVDYSEETRAWFDVMPSSHSGTLRPALVSGGRLLKKGLAAEGY